MLPNGRVQLRALARPLQRMVMRHAIGTTLGSHLAE